jgi:hypothetical protein
LNNELEWKTYVKCCKSDLKFKHTFLWELNQCNSESENKSLKSEDQTKVYQNDFLKTKFSNEIGGFHQLLTDIFIWFWL